MLLVAFSHSLYKYLVKGYFYQDIHDFRADEG